jgi:CheY-like chemotaxis protein
MPGVDGLEVCRHLRRDPRTQHVPIIIISSDQQPDLVRRAHEAGANHFLLKPLTLDVLEQTLSTALTGETKAHE